MRLRFQKRRKARRSRSSLCLLPWLLWPRHGTQAFKALNQSRMLPRVDKLLTYQALKGCVNLISTYFSVLKLIKTLAKRVFWPKRRHSSEVCAANPALAQEVSGSMNLRVLWQVGEMAEDAEEAYF